MTTIRFTLLSLMIALMCIPLSSCVTVVDAVSEDPIQTDPTKRSFGEYWDDKQLRTIVAVNLKKADPALDKSKIKVRSYNSVILITGQVESKELYELAGKTAREVNRVRLVYNELQLAPKIKFVDSVKDSWIGTKIKTKLLFYKDIKSSRVEVYVEDRVVYLMGMLSKAQTEKITNVVRRQRGVKKVVRAIEYID
jgi:osmotically-inducible protein OsmY